MQKVVERFWQGKTNVAKVVGALVSLSALFVVNIYGYLSVLPSGMLAVIGPDFLFNYSLQFSMSVAMASLIGWQFGDVAFILTRSARYFSEKKFGKIEYLKVILKFLSLDFLGEAKRLTLRYSIGVVSFCFLFSGFDVLISILLIAELLIIWAFAASYLEHRQQTESPIPLKTWLYEFAIEIFDTDWRRLEIATLVPVAIFFSLFLSNKIGEDRANRVLESEPVFLSQLNLHAVPFATSNVGLILAISNREEGEKRKMGFVLLGNSGDEILRSIQDR